MPLQQSYWHMLKEPKVDIYVARKSSVAGYNKIKKNNDIMQL